MDDYSTQLKSGAHWSLRVRRGVQLSLVNTTGNVNVGMVFFNSDNLAERYNAPDTLKAQHTFKITKGHCLYSDMGRIFASVVEDSHGWHDTVCGNTHAEHISTLFGTRSYQQDRNDWHQNGSDAFHVELQKYGLPPQALPANLNWFSTVVTDDEGHLSLRPNDDSMVGARVDLRFEMDTLVVLHTCPHPLEGSAHYPRARVGLTLSMAEPITQDDLCLNLCPENQRGFANNALYHFGLRETP